MAKPKDKLPERAEKYPKDAKVGIVNMIVSGEETVASISRTTGATPHTVAKWLEELAPGFHALEKIDELDIDIAEERADRLAVAARMVVIKRILDLVRHEKNLSKLAMVLKELKKDVQAPPGVQMNFFTQYVQDELKKYKHGS